MTRLPFCKSKSSACPLSQVAPPATNCRCAHPAFGRPFPAPQRRLRRSHPLRTRMAARNSRRLNIEQCQHAMQPEPPEGPSGVVAVRMSAWHMPSSPSMSLNTCARSSCCSMVSLGLKPCKHRHDVPLVRCIVLPLIHTQWCCSALRTALLMRCAVRMRRLQPTPRGCAKPRSSTALSRFRRAAHLAVAL